MKNCQYLILYVGNSAQELPIDVPFDTDACNLIVPKVENFSDLNLVSNSDLPMVRIVGELDPFYIDKDIMTEFNSSINLVIVSHFLDEAITRGIKDK